MIPSTRGSRTPQASAAAQDEAPIGERIGHAFRRKREVATGFIANISTLSVQGGVVKDASRQ
ncbi:hypothetical protein NKH84_24740 [Mesorhizobium sp. M0902]|uniref:hypothetical protein n=1 Tax=unclassified Mesorhizobium TaxID=325217 RepID=UPI00333A6965